MTASPSVPLSLRYLDEPAEDREVSAYTAEKLYHSRGSVREAAAVLRRGSPPGFSHGIDSSFSFKLDGPSYPGADDRRSLSFPGALMSAAEFLSWYDEAAAKEDGDDFFGWND